MLVVGRKGRPAQQPSMILMMMLLRLTPTTTADGLLLRPGKGRRDAKGSVQCISTVIVVAVGVAVIVDAHPASLWRR
jgi:hypothetical protein